MLVQLDLFDQKTSEELIHEQLKLVKESSDKVRRGIFAKHGELAKMYLELHCRLEVIEKHICTITLTR